MKKLNLFLLALVVGSISFMTACQDDDDDVVVDLTPTLNFVGGSDYVSESTTLETGEEFKVGINASSNSNSNADLANFKITRVFNNNPQVVYDTTLNTGNFSVDIITNAQPAEGTERWIFRITDEDGEFEEKDFIITTEASANPIISYSQTTLGSWDANIGSSFASLDGSVYQLSEAKVNSAKVDIMYYWDADVNENASIVAPVDAVAAIVFSNATYGVATWQTRNDTRLKIVEDVVVWADITDDTEIVNLTSTGMDATLVQGLQVGDIVAFETDPAKPDFAGKKGLIRITEINAGADGTITFDVKVQE